LEPEHKTSSRQKIRKYGFRILKTAIKVVVITMIYLFSLQILGQTFAIIPGLQGMLTTFVTIYVALMVVSDLTSGMLIQHFFNGAKSLFVIAYFIFSLNSGIIDLNLGNMNLIIDVRLFLMLATLFELLALAKSIIQGIHFVNEKIELTII
jgi:hypothetical protein